jgi:hypothetical protein
MEYISANRFLTLNLHLPFLPGAGVGVLQASAGAGAVCAGDCSAVGADALGAAARRHRLGYRNKDMQHGYPTWIIGG